jgi:hypothetical protein
MEKFLDSLSKGTLKSYRRGLELFLEFYGKDVDMILAERKDDLTPRPNENLVDAKNRASRYATIYPVARVKQALSNHFEILETNPMEKGRIVIFACRRK